MVYRIDNIYQLNKIIKEPKINNIQFFVNQVKFQLTKYLALFVGVIEYLACSKLYQNFKYQNYEKHSEIGFNEMRVFYILLINSSVQK